MPSVKLHIYSVLLNLALVLGLGSVVDSAAACDGPKEVREATSASIKDFANLKRMKILTFTGYSGAQYEDQSTMLELAERILTTLDPASTLVNIGATAEGIGQVYEVAKRHGFTTIGIVSTLARDENVPFSPCVDHVFLVLDNSWGGRLKDESRLSPTSAAIVANSSRLVGIGGGDVARDEMLAAREAGKPITFIPADMNHRLAIEKSRKRGQAEPIDFRGSAHTSLDKGN
jgi:hypothetical protein